MIRKIIKINEEKCNGCGLCADACHEGAIHMVNGKAKLIKDDYCDGLGDCLPACSADAISFEEREAAEYDEEAVKKNILMKKRLEINTGATLNFECPGSKSKTIERTKVVEKNDFSNSGNLSQLNQWPVQIKLISPSAKYLQGSDLLIAADCTAYAYADFHNKFIKNKITLIGCPKLDEGDYSQKLTEIFKLNDIKSITVVRMEVPCCGGIVSAVKNAIKASGNIVPWQIVTISTNGEIIE